jgi:glyoxylase-like metal-dependent hydrolase (beta-lactamase superfamily II)
VRLSSGTLAVFSPVALTEDAKAKIAEMGGNVGYIIALDIEHHIFISEWAKAFPDAKIIGPEGLPEKRAKQSDDKIGKEKFSVVFTKDKKSEIRISDEFDADFDYEYMDGHANREIVFFYRPEKVLVQADLIFNLPATEQYSKVPEAERQNSSIPAKAFAGIQSTEGDAKWMKRFQWYFAGKDRASFIDSIKRIEQWDFNTIIPCHGDVMEGNGKEIFHKVFEWHLKGSKN